MKIKKFAFILLLASVVGGLFAASQSPLDAMELSRASLVLLGDGAESPG